MQVAYDQLGIDHTAVSKVNFDAQLAQSMLDAAGDMRAQIAESAVAAGDMRVQLIKSAGLHAGDDMRAQLVRSQLNGDVCAQAQLNKSELDAGEITARVGAQLAQAKQDAGWFIYVRHICTVHVYLFIS